MNGYFQSAAFQENISESFVQTGCAPDAAGNFVQYKAALTKGTLSIAPTDTVNSKKFPDMTANEVLPVDAALNRMLIDLVEDENWDSSDDEDYCDNGEEDEESDGGDDDNLENEDDSEDDSEDWISKYM